MEKVIWGGQDSEIICLVDDDDDDDDGLRTSLSHDLRYNALKFYWIEYKYKYEVLWITSDNFDLGSKQRLVTLLMIW